MSSGTAEGGRRVAPEDLYETGDEVTGEFRCADCDLLIKSPRESDGVLVLPVCALCHAERWRRVG